MAGVLSIAEFHAKLISIDVTKLDLRNKPSSVRMKISLYVVLDLEYNEIACC